MITHESSLAEADQAVSALADGGSGSIKVQVSSHVEQASDWVWTDEQTRSKHGPGWPSQGESRMDITQIGTGGSTKAPASEPSD